MSTIFEREAKVLVPGVGQGLEQAAMETWGNIKSSARALEKDPLGATGSYLGDHWQDFAAGAAIAAIAPGKTASKLLLAWSLRGVGMATIDAAAQAASGDADTNAIRDSFAHKLGHEGASFVSSLPMTLAGGAVGRMGANAFLGEGKGLVDVGRGDVSMADIRRNSSNLMESAFPTTAKVLLTDLDDTAFPLKDYLVPSLQKNVSMISERMGIPESQVIKALGPNRIHPWILEQSDLAKAWKGTPEQFTEQIVKPFWQNDAEAMRQLKPFEGVVQTWEEAHRQGLKVVALTNAPRPWAINRLKAAGLDGYVDHLYAMETPEPVIGELLSPSFIEHGRSLVQQAETTPNGIGQIHSLKQGFQKPDVHGIQTVLNDLDVKPRQVLAIGDNWNGDGAAPEYFGVPFIWAKYGREVVNPEYKSFLRRFKPRSDDTAPVEPAPIEAEHPQAIHAADSYADLLQFLNRGASPCEAFGRLTNGMTARNLLPATLGWDLAWGQK
jgi:FMN phosphatase YigB (HAD superfamily)